MSRRIFLFGLLQPATLRRDSGHIMLMSGEDILTSAEHELVDGWAAIGTEGYGFRVRPGTVYHDQLKDLQGHKVALAIKDFGA